MKFNSRVTFLCVFAQDNNYTTIKYRAETSANYYKKLHKLIKILLTGMETNERYRLFSDSSKIASPEISTIQCVSGLRFFPNSRAPLSEIESNCYNCSTSLRNESTTQPQIFQLRRHKFTVASQHKATSSIQS